MDYKEYKDFLIKWMRKWRLILNKLPYNSLKFKRAYQHIRHLDLEFKDKYTFSNQEAIGAYLDNIKA